MALIIVMANSYFQFKQFTVNQHRCAMKVTTDGCLFGAWVAAELEKKAVPVKTVLDIGTGTGLLSLMVAQKCRASIDAVEIDPGAAVQAEENCEASPFKNIKVLQGNILELSLPLYDVILSNPPFYEAELASPHAGRAAAHHGSQLRWEELFRFIGAHLTPGGQFFLLLPFKRVGEIEGLLRSAGLHLHQKVVVKPTPAHAPFRILLCGGNTAAPAVMRDITIRETQNNYTPEFEYLLKDYYLYL